MTAGSDRLRRRRCIGLRVAFLFGIILAVLNRSDMVLLAIALVGTAIAVIAFWRDCRQPRRTS
ncbi:MAG TPA: hypothetical protein VNB65_04780 [Gaiellaceae bacterium]|jgi:hypothetical protein|nr:hypothetical protein [Gaiellaceae bacterium]